MARPKPETGGFKSQTSRSRIFVLILEAVIFLASIPLSASVTEVWGPQRPELTLDVCHPLQAPIQASTPALVAPSSAAWAIAEPAYSDVYEDTVTHLISRPVDSLDPPPPKAISYFQN